MVNDDGVEMVYFSEDNRRLAVLEWNLYELTSVDEEGVSHYKLIGTTNKDEQADNYLDNAVCTYISVTADTDTRSITDERDKRE